MLDEIDVNPSTHFPFAIPSSTPATTAYPNLQGSQFTKNNFQPAKRKFRRVPSALENEASLKKVLRDYWGHRDFRGPQLDICMAAMKGLDILAVAPTGLGKSVCFQVPAVALDYGITLVISPLLALMNDQVVGLQQKGIKVGMLNGTADFRQVAEIKRQLTMAHPQLRMVYTTPESLFDQDCKSFNKKISYELRTAYKNKQLRRLVIDEAHIIEEWGPTIRAQYRCLGLFREEFPDVPITALTASATEAARTDIRRILNIRKTEVAQWVEPFNRKNLFYEVCYQSQMEEAERILNLAKTIRRCKAKTLERASRKDDDLEVVTGLVYCRDRRTCEDVAAELARKGLTAQPFHANISDDRKKRVMADWKAGAIECVVATTAFGMGIDHAQVRYVIHYDMPRTFEGYYQETGRAGRDGHLSMCIVFYSREDALQVYRQKGSAARKAQERLDEAAENDEEVDRYALRAKIRGANSFKHLQQYMEASNTCRHVAICRFFGEAIDDTDPATLKAYCDNMCDVCCDRGVVYRRAQFINDEVEVASQVVPDKYEPPDTPPSRRSDRSGPTVLSLDVLHEAEGSDVLSSPGLGTCRPRLDPLSEEEGSPSSGRRVRLRVDDADEDDAANEESGQEKGEVAPRVIAPRAPPPPTTGLGLGRVTRPFNTQEVTALRNIVRSLPRPRMSEDVAQFHTAALETPCPRPGRRSVQAGPSRAGPPAHAGPSSHAGPSTFAVPRARGGLTTSDVSTGEYAVPDPLPQDPETRQKQRDAFRAITPVTGRGPYAYYSNTAPPVSMGGRRRLMGAASGSVSGPATPFRTPFFEERVTQRVGTISEQDRVAAINDIKEAMTNSFVNGPQADLLASAWPRSHTRGTRRMLTRLAVVELEAIIVQDCPTPDRLRAEVQAFTQSLKILRTEQGAQLVANGLLSECEDGAEKRHLMMFDSVMREVGERKA